MSENENHIVPGPIPPNQQPLDPAARQYPQNQQPLNPAARQYSQNQQPLNPAARQYPQNQQPLNPAARQYPQNQQPLNPAARQYPQNQQPLEQIARAEEEQNSIEEVQPLPAKQKTARKRGIKALCISLIVLVILAGLGVGGYLLLEKLSAPKRNYDEAKQLLDKGKYDEAYEKFTELGEYGNSEEMARETLRLKAKSLVNDGQYDEAIKIFTQLEDYENSAQRITEVKLQQAAALSAEGRYAEAVELYTEIAESMKDKSARNNVNYLKAKAMRNNGDLEEAEAQFIALGDYEDCPELSQETGYLLAAAYVEEGKKAEGIRKYEALGNYRDSNTRRNDLIVAWLKDALTEDGAIPDELLRFKPDEEWYSDIYSFLTNHIDSVSQTGYYYSWDFGSGRSGEAGKLADALSLLPDSYQLVGNYRSVMTWIADPYNEYSISDLFIKNKRDMVALWDTEFRNSLMNSNTIICKFMLGYWKDYSGNYFYNYKESTNSDFAYTVSCNIPTIEVPSNNHSIFFENQQYVFYDSNQNPISTAYYFEFPDWDTMIITSACDGCRYYLYRV